MFEHGHVRVLEYIDCNCEYWMREGASTWSVLVIVINEVYKRRIVIDKMNKKMNNRVVIR